MRAIAQERYGGPDVLQVSEVDTPVATGDQVLVRVHAAAVNARDWHVMRGDPYVARLMDRSVFGLGRPRAPIRGTDFSGRVAAVGDRVTRLRPGDEVFGEADGAFAEFVCAPEGVVETKPTNLSFEQAAALPLAANTALMGLREVAQVKPGQRVLINGASGGVGTFAVQIAASMGAEVTGVCSTGNVDLIRGLGAHHVVDYKHEDFTRHGRRYDVVLDLVGNRSLSDYRRVLAPEGTLVLSGGGVSKGGSLVGPVGLIVKGQLLSRFLPYRIQLLPAAPSRARLVAVRELAESEAIRPVIDRTYPLSEVAEAIRYVEVEHARAKVVITV